MPTIMIDCEGLTKRFGDHTAIDRLSLQVNQGEIFGLVGPDGAGKTTTIRMLCGVMTLDDGGARVAGIDVRLEPDALKHLGVDHVLVARRISVGKFMNFTRARSMNAP